MKVCDLIKQKDIKEKAYNVCKDFEKTLPAALRVSSNVRFYVEDGVAFIQIAIQGDLVHRSIYQDYIPPKTITTEIGVFEVKKCVYGSISFGEQKNKEDILAENILNYKLKAVSKEILDRKHKELDEILLKIRNKQPIENDFSKTLDQIYSKIPKNMLQNMSIRTSIDNTIIITIYKNEALGIVEGSLQNIDLPSKIDNYTIEIVFCDENIKAY